MRTAGVFRSSIVKSGWGCLTSRVQLELFNRLPKATPAADEWLVVGSRPVRLHWARHRRARRYILRLKPDGSAWVTIPRGGTETEARSFVQRHTGWIQKRLERLAAQPVRNTSWTLGSEILFRGEKVRIEAGSSQETGQVRLGSEVVRVPDLTGNLRPAIERHLRKLAASELPTRVTELAALHQLSVKRVTVRSQRSRWGSCSRRGTLSLNWRIIQAGPFVRDYLILHELMHLREMNHSKRFWREVERVCPGYGEAERWLKEHSELLAPA
ncbi:MAG: SprT family zinc-dependent metalloprotease [Verrucomicrobia bacterium]|nr:SprT family zinc-dependent metalloprotease [Verrucomicrobiota bacterium]